MGGQPRQHPGDCDTIVFRSVAIPLLATALTGRISISYVPDAIPFVTTILGMIRANCAAFPISPRNSPAAVAHLLDKIGPRHILVGREQAMQDLVAQSLDILRSQYGMESEIKLSPMLTYSDLYLSGEATTVEDVPYTRQSSDIPALIMHSSGQ